jgi:hypothetical protein
MHPRLALVSLGPLLAAASAPAVELVSADRYIAVGVSTLTTKSDSGFAPFDDYVFFSQSIPFAYDYTASASHASDPSEAGIHATGEVNVAGIYSPVCPCAPPKAISNFELVFDVDVPTPFALTGTLETQASYPPLVLLSGELFVQASLTPVGGGPPIASFGSVPASTNPSTVTVPVAASGTLDPGGYRFAVESQATSPLNPNLVASTTATYDVWLDLTGAPVPVVPATPDSALVLLALALLAGAGGALATRPARDRSG